MRKKIFIILAFFVIVSSLGYYELNRTMNQETFYKNIIKNFVPQNLRGKIKETFFSKKFKKMELERKVKGLQLKNAKLNESIVLKNRKIYDLLTEGGKINFELTEDKSIANLKYKFNLKKFSTSDLLVGKNPLAISTSYIDHYDKNLFIISGDGLISYAPIENFVNNNISFKIIKSNILELINDPKFFVNSYIGVKDFKIIDKNLYMSYSFKLREDCYNTSVLVGELNYEKIIFEKFFSPNQCVPGSNDFGIDGKWAQGGRIINKNENEIYFTVGTWGYETLSQDKNSVFGKILSINKQNKEFKIVSLGHRNPQGLDLDGNFLIETEHGPVGGDELNIINTLNNEDKNYGWPISSYGEHGVWKNIDQRIDFYKKAPLHKSHKKYGFIEPKKFWTPCIGISQVVKISNTFLKNSYPTVVVGAMGSDIEEGDMSLHIVEFNENYQEVINHSVLVINKRIRDLIYISEIETLVMFLETSAEIALLKIHS